MIFKNIYNKKVDDIDQIIDNLKKSKKEVGKLINKIKKIKNENEFLDYQQLKLIENFDFQLIDSLYDYNYWLQKLIDANKREK